MSPAEAISRVNESVVVEVVVRRTKCCTGSRQVFLDSEANHRDPKNLGVVVTEDGRAKFGAAGIDDPTAHSKGKTDKPNFYKLFARLAKRAGAPKVRPYDTRHSCASMLLRAGMSVRAVADRFGHKNPSMTLEKYAHCLPSESSPGFIPWTVVRETTKGGRPL